MKLVQIQKHNLPQYASILPESLLRYPCEIFVCVKNELPCGAIALEKLENRLGITWFWVAPKQRRLKLGSALLIKAYHFAKENHYTAITIAYDPDEPWAAILEYMLAKIEFQLFTSPFTKYRITAEKLSDAPLMRNFHIYEDRPSRTKALSALSPKDMTRLQLQCQKDNNLLLSHSNFSKAAPQKTRLFYHENQLKGLTMVNFTNVPGEYELAMVYLHPAYTTSGPTLFRETAAELLKDSNHFSALQFTCVTNTTVRLADVLLGDTEKTMKPMCHGILKLS